MDYVISNKAQSARLRAAEERELANPLGGALDTVPVLRQFLKQ